MYRLEKNINQNPHIKNVLLLGLFTVFVFYLHTYYIIYSDRAGLHYAIPVGYIGIPKCLHSSEFTENFWWETIAFMDCSAPSTHWCPNYQEKCSNNRILETRQNQDVEKQTNFMQEKWWTRIWYSTSVLFKNLTRTLVAIPLFIASQLTWKESEGVDMPLIIWCQATAIYLTERGDSPDRD